MCAVCGGHCLPWSMLVLSTASASAWLSAVLAVQCLSTWACTVFESGACAAGCFDKRRVCCDGCGCSCSCTGKLELAGACWSRVCCPACSQCPCCCCSCGGCCWASPCTAKPASCLPLYRSCCVVSLSMERLQVRLTARCTPGVSPAPCAAGCAARPGRPTSCSHVSSPLCCLPMLLARCSFSSAPAEG